MRRERLTMGGQIGGEDRFSRVEIGIDFHWRIVALESGRDENIGVGHEGRKCRKRSGTEEADRVGESEGCRAGGVAGDFGGAASGDGEEEVLVFLAGEMEGVEEEVHALIRLKVPDVQEPDGGLAEGWRMEVWIVVVGQEGTIAQHGYALGSGGMCDFGQCVADTEDPRRLSNGPSFQPLEEGKDEPDLGCAFHDLEGH